MSGYGYKPPSASPTNHDRNTLNFGHEITDVCFSAFYVRCWGQSSRNSGLAFTTAFDPKRTLNMEG
jgi:hypothetical protein